MFNLNPFKDDLPVPDVVKPLKHDHKPRCLVIKAVVEQVKLHQDLPETEVWSYRLKQGKVIKYGSGSSYLGPTVEVNKGDLVNVCWENEINESSSLPYEVVKVPYIDGAIPVPQNQPGVELTALNDMDDKLRAKVRDLQATLATHLHGGRTQADSDGWPDNTITAGQSAHCTYHNDQNAAMLWYHDHANHVTRLNVYAGLAGVWLVRDEEEDALDLPTGGFELPLVIQDRNLDLESAGNFTGALLHKTEVIDPNDPGLPLNPQGGPAEFFGPYSLVNGKIWPKAEVEPRLYRLRVLNGSNARTYRLMLLDAQGNTQNSNIWQIGCDQGLMQFKVPVPKTGLILMPGERVDLLVDFCRFSNQSLYLWNTAEAPFGNATLPVSYFTDIQSELLNFLSNPTSASGDEMGRRFYPQVMRFDVASAISSAAHNLPNGSLWTAPHPPVNLNAAMPIRLVALVEKPADQMQLDGTPMLVFWEYVRNASEPAPAGADIVNFTYVHPTTGLIVTEGFWKAAEEFYDRLNWQVHLDDTEQWYIANVSPDTHPIHVHLVDMQVNQQYQVSADGFTVSSLGIITPFSGVTEIDGNIDTITDIHAATVPVAISTDQTGPKDTIRINPGEMVGVAIKFSPFCGRYMYHCHILEHEDDDMMRPFVVVPKWVPHHHH
ncbi:MAG: multicopper oxidase domain-containing protein [Methylococcales bacterium]